LKWRLYANSTQRETQGNIKIKDIYDVCKSTCSIPKSLPLTLCKKTEEESTDILCIQEPYIIQNKVVGIPKKYRNYTNAETRSRAAIVVTNKHIDVLLLKQLSGADAVVVEIPIDGVKLILTSMYFDIGRQIEVDLSKIEAVLQYANGAGILLAIDSKARSASWCDTKTNARGRTLD
jgi:hypothetical protein